MAQQSWPLFPNWNIFRMTHAVLPRHKPFLPSEHHALELAPYILSEMSPCRPGTTKLIMSSVSVPSSSRALWQHRNTFYGPYAATAMLGSVSPPSHYRRPPPVSTHHNGDPECRMPLSSTLIPSDSTGGRQSSVLLPPTCYTSSPPMYQADDCLWLAQCCWEPYHSVDGIVVLHQLPSHHAAPLGL